MNAAEKACEVFKMLRAEWRSCNQVASELGIRADSAADWIAEYERQGLVISREGPKSARGPAAKQYRLAPEWGGVPG